MRFGGIDMGGERHVVAVVDEEGTLSTVRASSEKMLQDTHDCSSCWGALRIT